MDINPAKPLDSPNISLLNGEMIKSMGLIENPVEASYRASTYDLTIGDIITPTLKGNDMGSLFELLPGGTVKVVSKEMINLPVNITGHVLLKNELCSKGVLAINIGVVDPLFNGPLSSTLINFGKQSFFVRIGEPFLRVSFYFSSESKNAKALTWDRESYIKHIKTESLAYISSNFLNVEQTASTAAEKAFGSFRKQLVVWIAIGSAWIALLSIFTPMVISNSYRLYDNLEKFMALKWADSSQKYLLQEYEKRISGLESQIEELNKNEQIRIKSLKKTSPVSKTIRNEQ